MSSDLSKNITKINKSAKKYFETKVDLIKLSFLEKSTRFTALLINLWILGSLFILIIGFLFAAFAIWYGSKYGNYAEGMLIAGGLLLLLALIFVVFRKRLVTNTVLRHYSKIIFDESNDDKL